MPRVKRGFKARRRRNRVLKLAKGFVMGRRRVWRRAAEQVDRSLMSAYRDRRRKKRDMRSLWIARINAASRLNGTTYGRMIDSLKKSGIELDRKILADIAVTDPKGFSKIVSETQIG